MSRKYTRPPKPCRNAADVVVEILSTATAPMRQSTVVDRVHSWTGYTKEAARSAVNLCVDEGTVKTSGFAVGRGRFGRTRLLVLTDFLETP
mgnify:CR=1 FL=1